MKKLLSFLTLLCMPLSAQYYFPLMLSEQPSTGNEVYVEPKVSYAKYKTKEITEKATLYGIKGGYDLLRFDSLYLGFESVYLAGKFKTDYIQSKYKDFSFEGKMGYTFGEKLSLALIPYAGIGFAHEKYDFSLPPVEKMNYYYLTVGANSRFYVKDNLTIGLDVKVKIPFKGKHHIKNEWIDQKASFSRKLQYVVEVPLIYWTSLQSFISVTPFYELKYYNNNSTGHNWTSGAKMSQLGIGTQIGLAF